MAAVIASSQIKSICDACAPKQVAAITSCKGCLKDFCRKHFNEHRDKISNDMHNVFDRHDLLLQEFQQKIDRTSKIPKSDNARTLIEHINEWEVRTIESVTRLADETRTHLECLFSTQSENDQLKKMIDQITDQLKEQQELENFVETDIDQWMKQLEQLKTDLNQPSTAETNPPVLQIQHIDWNTIIKICPPGETHEKFVYLAENEVNTANQTESLLMDCPICCCSFSPSQMEKMFLCGHMCCVFCIKEYYRQNIKTIRDPKALNRLTCFVAAHEIPEHVKLNFFQYLETKFNQWFIDERLVLDLYHENFFIATRGSQIKKCGNSKCVGFFDTNNNNRIARFQCPHCQFQQCQQCCRKWWPEHRGKQCEEYAEWLIENDPDDPEVQLIKYLNTVGIACPNPDCRAVYEYDPMGCSHFICRRCSTEFCPYCSELFYNPAKGNICPRVNCPLKTSLHAHCFLNCYREIRCAAVNEISALLTNYGVNLAEELQHKSAATSDRCVTEGCQNATLVISENRFCRQELYDDRNLRAKLINASVSVPKNATRTTLIKLARQNLTPFLGKPKQILKLH